MAGFVSAINTFLAVPFGFVLSLFYQITNSYILAIILLTVLIRAALLPASIKQQKGSAKQVRLSTKVNKIKQKYAGDQKKIQEETQALYQREGFGMGNMGCLPMGIQMVVMMGLYGVIVTPLSSVLRLSTAKITAMKGVMASVLATVSGNSRGMIEITMLDNVAKFKTQLTGVLSQADFGALARLSSKYSLFGLNFSVIPDKGHFDVYWIIPIVSFLTALLSSVYMLIIQRKQNPDMVKNPAMGCTALMPAAFSLIFAFMFPSGVGFYWIVSNVISFIQQVVLSNIYSPKKVIAQQMVEETIVRRSKENNTKLRVQIEKK